MNAGFGVGAVRFDTDLATGQANGFESHGVDCHRHEGHTDLFASGQQHIHLACRRFFVDLFGQLDQRVGVLAHGTDDHDHLVSLLVGSDSLASCGKDFFTVCDTGTAKLLDDQRH